MKLLGLTSIEALLIVLLVEACWWSTLFLVSNLIPGIRSWYIISSISWTRQVYSRKKWEILTSGILIFLRFKVPLLLVIIVLKNRLNEHCQLIKIWFYLTNILDTVLVIYYVGLRFYIEEGESTVGLLSEVVLFLVLRVIIVGFSHGFVKELSVKDGTLFPVAGFSGLFIFLSKHVDSLVKVILGWELIWEIIKLSQFLDFRNKKSFFVPWFYGPFDIDVIIGSVCPVAICALQLLAVQKKWKLLFFIFTIPYFFLILLGTIYLIVNITVNHISYFQYSGRNVNALTIFEVIIEYMLLFGNLLLKMIGFIGICCLIWNEKMSHHYWTKSKSKTYDDYEKDSKSKVRDNSSSTSAISPLLQPEER